ncbi:ABC transporter substrate-binding protein [Epibacterium ulvae]|uniref:ABC transporter substrate-binding protein n=1 Tax=Epibacterium ulvae TaxID=1156985 RepID=UPI001BFC1ECD|nr:ABC transporter substrate-binding protein [Epibacterium ulvae]MBT8153793.1 ABC transporter substrate-binding protein [Epibacterium ulvae]
MRYFIALILVFCATLTLAQDWEDERLFGEKNAAVTLRVLSSTDTDYLAAMIDGFIAQNPDLAVEYLVTGTQNLNRVMRADPGRFDLVISSAMDLQIKLVNDGFASALDDITSPEWTHWRNSLFGFTAEPAAIVLHKSVLANHPAPETRQDLIRLLRAEPDLFRNRVATYDIRTAGLGYLFAAQDARTSETYWRLSEVMGGLGTRLYCCSGTMIDAVARGDMLVAYNVLGSYAAAQAQDHPQIEVIVPADFATTMMRTVLVSRRSSKQDNARNFVAYMLEHFSNPPPLGTPQLPQLLSKEGQKNRQVIPLEPALMIYLDRLKRQAFTREWESAVIQ